MTAPFSPDTSTAIFLRRHIPRPQPIQWIEEPTLHFIIASQSGPQRYYNSRVPPLNLSYGQTAPNSLFVSEDEVTLVLEDLRPLVRTTLNHHRQPAASEAVHVTIKPSDNEPHAHIEQQEAAKRYEQYLDEQRRSTFNFIQQFKRLHSGALIPALLAIKDIKDIPLVLDLQTFRADVPRTANIALEYRRAILRSRDVLLRPRSQIHSTR